MSDYRKIPTSAEVWAVIHARHEKELKVFSTYSAPEGDVYGNSEQAVMLTEYCLEGSDYPLIGARTTWPIGDRDSRITQYWICAAKEPQP